MAFKVEEYPNCLILPTDWKEKKENEIRRCITICK